MEALFLEESGDIFLSFSTSPLHPLSSVILFCNVPSRSIPTVQQPTIRRTRNKSQKPSKTAQICGYRWIKSDQDNNRFVYMQFGVPIVVRHVFFSSRSSSVLVHRSSKRNSIAKPRYLSIISGVGVTNLHCYLSQSTFNYQKLPRNLSHNDR